MIQKLSKNIVSRSNFFFFLKCATNHAIFTCQLSHLKNHSNHIPKPSISFKSPSKSIKPIFHFSSTLEPINRALIPHNFTHQKFSWVVKEFFSLLPHLACVDELFFSSPSFTVPWEKSLRNFVPSVILSLRLSLYFLAFYFFLVFLHFILFLFNILIFVIYFPAIKMYLGPM